MTSRSGPLRRLSFAVAMTAAALGRADTVVTMDGRTLAGVVSVDRRSFRVGGATVAVANVLDVSLDHPVRTAGQACVLVGGTVLAGRIDGIDDRQVRVTTPAVGTVPVPAGQVARVEFGPTSGEALARVPAGAGGLLLRGGDFFDGAFQGFDGRAVTMSSPLLGEATFGIGDAALALVWRPTVQRGNAAGWTVRTTDGSVLIAGDLTLTGGAVRVGVAGAGPIAVRLADVVEARAWGGPVVGLADVGPARGAVTVDGTPIGLPARLVGTDVGRSVCVSAGATVAYRLDRGYTAFACRVGVPAGVVPMAGVRWAVRVDGRPVAGGGGRTSVDDPVTVAAGLTGARELAVSVDPMPGGGVVLLADPVLVRTPRNNN